MSLVLLRPWSCLSFIDPTVWRHIYMLLSVCQKKGSGWFTSLFLWFNIYGLVMKTRSALYAELVSWASVAMESFQCVIWSVFYATKLSCHAWDCADYSSWPTCTEWAGLILHSHRYRCRKRILPYQWYHNPEYNCITCFNSTTARFF